MQKITFNVSCERVNENESRTGGTDRRGFLCKALSLRNALKLMDFDIDSAEFVEFSQSPLKSFAYDVWLSKTGRNHRTWDSVTNSLHPSRPLSSATWLRIRKAL